MSNDLKLQVLLEAIDKASTPLRHIDSSSKSLGKALRATSAELRHLKSEQEQLTGFRKLKNAADSSGNALHAAQQRTRQLRVEMDATEAPTRQAAAAYAKAEREVTKLKRAHLANLTATRSGRQALTAAGISARNFGSAERELQARVDRTTQSLKTQQIAARRLGEQQQRLASIEQHRSKLGGKLFGTVAAVAGVSYVLGRGVGAGNEFDYQLQLIGNTADMTGAQVEGLRKKIMIASKATGQSATTVEKSLGFLIAAGQDTDTASRSIVAIGRTSTAAGADIEDVSRAAFTLTDALNVKPEGLQKALDILAQAGKEGNVELRDMAKQLPVLGAGFRSFKMQGNEATATLGAALEIARKGAADPDEAANNMRNYMAKVLSPTTLAKAKSAFGIDLYKVITDAQTSGGNPFEASIESVMKATGGDQKKLGELFQDMQVQNFLKPMMQNWSEYQRIKAKALSATGVTDRDFAKVMATAKQQLDNATHAAGRLGLALNHTLAPGLGRIAAAITPVLDRMTAFVDKHPKVVGSIAAIVASLVGMRVALLGIRYAWTFVGGGVASRAVASLRKTLAAHAAEKVAGAASGAPALAGRGIGILPGIGAAITAIGMPVLLVGAALAAVAFLVWKYWGPIKAFFIGFGQGLKAAVGPALAGLATALAPLKPVWDAIAAAMGAVWAWLTRLFQPFNATKKQLDGATASGRSFGQVLGAVLAFAVNQVTRSIKAFVWLGQSIGTAIGWVVVSGGKVIDWLGKMWPTVSDAIKAPFSTAFAWIGGKIDAFMAKWQWLKEKLGMGDKAAPAGIKWNTGGPGDSAPPARFDTGGPLRAGASQGGGVTHVGGINVVQQPGESGDALARRIRMEIAAHERGKTVASRSALTDAE